MGAWGHHAYNGSRDIYGGRVQDYQALHATGQGYVDSRGRYAICFRAILRV